MDYIPFERKPQIQQLSIYFESTTDKVSEILETANTDITTTISMVQPIFNRKF